MNLEQLAPDEPLSPELVLVLSPQLRAQALASLGPPSWPKPRPRVAVASTPVDEPFRAPIVTESLGHILAARVVQLAVIFVLVTILTLAMSVVAHAIR